MSSIHEFFRKPFVGYHRTPEMVNGRPIIDESSEYPFTASIVPVKDSELIASEFLLRKESGEVFLLTTDSEALIGVSVGKIPDVVVNDNKSYEVISKRIWDNDIISSNGFIIQEVVL